MFERHQFYQRRQKEGETVEHFITDLRTLARTFDFTEDGKDFANQMIRDRLVCGIRNDVVGQRLLARENPSLSTCINECPTAEATQTQATEMRTILMLAATGRVKLEPNDETCLRTTTSQIGRRLLRNGKSGGALTAIGDTEKEGARHSARSVGTVDDQILLQRHAPNEHTQS